MSQDLKLSGSTLPDQPTSSRKNKSGWGCVAIGCLGLVALVILATIGVTVYIATLTEADLGAKIVEVIKNPDFSKKFKKGIRESTKISEQQKEALIALYDTFLRNYDKLPKDKQETINKDIFIVIKKRVTDAKRFKKEPPKEFREIVTILHTEELKSSITPQQPALSPPPTTTQPATQPPPKPTTPPSQPTYKTEYDF